MTQREEWLQAAKLARPLIFEYENPKLLRGQADDVHAYRDQGGWTIGFGVRTKKGEELDAGEAFEKYKVSERRKVDYILGKLGPDGDKGLSLNQKAQLYSFIHNVTERSGGRMLDILKSEDGDKAHFAAAQKFMDGIVRGAASKKVLPGLEARREDERLLGKGLYNEDTSRGPSLAGLHNLYTKFMKGIGEAVDGVAEAAHDVADGVAKLIDPSKPAASLKTFTQAEKLAAQKPLSPEDLKKTVEGIRNGTYTKDTPDVRVMAFQNLANRVLDAHLAVDGKAGIATGPVAKNDENVKVLTEASEQFAKGNPNYKALLASTATAAPQLPARNSAVSKDKAITALAELDMKPATFKELQKKFREQRHVRGGAAEEAREYMQSVVKADKGVRTLARRYNDDRKLQTAFAEVVGKVQLAAGFTGKDHDRILGDKTFAVVKQVAQNGAGPSEAQVPAKPLARTSSIAAQAPSAA